jgi:subtilase family serine protease
VNRRLALLGAAAMVVSSAATAGVAVAAPSASGVTHRNVRVCAAPTAGSAACHAIRHEFLDRHGKPTPPPTGDAGGYKAAALRAAYNLPTGVGNPTVAIVDAYHLPTAFNDVNVYRTETGAGPALSLYSGSSTPQPWFRQVSQRGDTAYPSADTGWGQEIALDIEMVSAICPNCNILLVEADSPTFSNLATAVNWAAGQSGVLAISNSYGGSEFSPIAAYDQRARGIAVTVSTGDSGYGVQSPASFPYVTAVGGTSLTHSGSTYAESAWSGAGSGCARYTDAVAWQSGVIKNCTKRGLADVSAVANPNTGVAVYDSYPDQGAGNWMVFGGTSASAPIIAAVYALDDTKDSTASYSQNQSAVTYLNRAGNFRDVTTGSNGRCRTAPALCTAGTGWDGPTGLGSPNGIGAF